MDERGAAAAPPVRVMIFEPYPFSKIAGNLRTLLHILAFADPRLVEPVLVVPFATGLVDLVREKGIQCVVLSPPEQVNRYGGQALRDGLLGRLHTAWGLLRYAWQVRGLLRRERFGVVYCNSVRALLTVGLGCKLARTPILLYIKGQLDNPMIDRLSLLMADRTLFFAPANRDDRYPRLIRWLGRRVGILPIGLDTREIDRIRAADHGHLRREFGLDEDRPEALNIAYVGQLYPPKGVHYLVEAFALVAERYPQARLFIIGHQVLDEYAGYVARLTARIAALGLTERVVMTGWREDATALVSLMDVLVHPSEAEGFGRAVLEAMALGLPVVVSRVGGLRNTIRDGENGFFVEVGDVHAIAQRLDRLLGDPALRATMGRAARETVYRDHRIEDKVAELAHIWNAMGRSVVTPPPGATDRRP